MRRAITTLAAALLFACTASQNTTTPNSASPSAAPAAASTTPTATTTASSMTSSSLEFDRTNLDPKVNACDDFYQYANGGWLSTHPIPPEFTAWGMSSSLGEENRQIMREALEAAANKPAAQRTANEQKLGDFWTSCMNESQIESAGITPLEPEFARIRNVGTVADLQREIAHLQMIGITSGFDINATQDAKNSSEVTAEVSQGGLGLPDRDYYLKDDPKTKSIRDEYRKHLGTMFSLLGDDAATAQRNADTVMRIETALATASMTRVERRDPHATYNRMSVNELARIAPGVDWPAYFASVGLGNIKELNVAQPKFMTALAQQLTTTPLEDWKTYLRWHLISGTASALSTPFAEESFRFRGGVLQGQKQQQPRWKRCVARANLQLGEALGQAYVDRKFPPEAKQRATELVNNLIAALHDDLGHLDWMSEATRKAATVKLETFVRKIGYPDQWRDYTKEQIVNGPYVLNALAGNAFEKQRDLAKVGQPVNRGEWGMTPPTFNAYYDPSLNEIVFPAGILQWPMFDIHQDDAFNYGAIGSVIGHEMTHGFDDQGSQYDAQGNLRNWWTEEDRKKFDARAECIVRQFEAYEIEPGIHHNGKLVAGESIADLGGAVIAWDAWQRSLQRKPRPATIGGFTPEQRFFLGFARARASNVTPEAMRLRIATDPHPASKFRVNGPLSNMPQFATAFQCKAGDAMVRSDRCAIW